MKAAVEKAAAERRAAEIAAAERAAYQAAVTVIILKGHSEYVRSVAFSSDGKRIVSGSSDKTVKIWDISPLTEGKGN